MVRAWGASAGSRKNALKADTAAAPNLKQAYDHAGSSGGTQAEGLKRRGNLPFWSTMLLSVALIENRTPSYRKSC